MDGATTRATCLRGCRNLIHRLLVDQSEASPRNAPPHVQHGWNTALLVETKKHYLVRSAVCRGCLSLPLPLVYSWLKTHIRIGSKSRPVEAIPSISKCINRVSTLEGITEQPGSQSLSECGNNKVRLFCDFCDTTYSREQFIFIVLTHAYTSL